MSFFPPAPQPDAFPPFVLWLKQEDLTPDGHFRPAVAVEIAPALRTSGLLREMAGEELKTLLLVLTFVTANGHCQPTLPQLADGLRLSSGKMQARLKRLQAFSWQGASLLHPIRQASGLYAYAPSAHVIASREAPSLSGENQEPVYLASGREAVIAHSRAAYTRPRAEVEREIALLNGWPLPETGEGPALPAADQNSEQREPYYLKQRLLRLGVSNEQADYLLAQHTVEEVAQQVEWLPYRNAKKPAGFLVAAIEGGYSEPLVLRRRRVLESTFAENSASEAGASQTDSAASEADTPDLPAFDVPDSVNLPLPAQGTAEANTSGGDMHPPC